MRYVYSHEGKESEGCSVERALCAPESDREAGNVRRVRLPRVHPNEKREQVCDLIGLWYVNSL